MVLDSRQREDFDDDVQIFSFSRNTDENVLMVYVEPAFKKRVDGFTTTAFNCAILCNFAISAVSLMYGQAAEQSNHYGCHSRFTAKLE